MALVIVTAEFPPIVGGVAAFSSALATVLISQDPSFRVVTSVPTDVSDLNDYVVRPPMHVNRKGLKAVWLTWAAWRAGRHGGPHGIVAMSWAHEGLAAWLVWRLTGMPYIVVCHGSEVLRHRTRPTHRLMQMVFKEARFVAANSAFTRDLVLEEGVREDRVVVVNPPVAQFDQPTRTELDGIRRRFDLQNRRIVFTAARLARRKGHLHMLRAVKCLLREFPDLCFVMTGEVSRRPDLTTEVDRLGLSGSVRMVGRVSPRDLQLLFWIAEVYVSPSEQDHEDVEGFGIALAEAGACGKPVVVGRGGGIADCVVDGVTGFVIEPGDVDELTVKVRALLADARLRDTMGAAARERIRVLCNPESQASRIRDLLTE
jgi:phosphatidylinositol alpha-1,6-mannosyltransferase